MNCPDSLPRKVLARVAMPVRWRDLDAFNHVNNASFLTFIEEARLRWLQSLSSAWLGEQSAPILAAVKIDYRQPINWPSELLVELHCARLGSTSITLGHRILDAQDDKVLYSDGESVMVWIDRSSGKSTALPAAVRAACV